MSTSSSSNYADSESLANIRMENKCYEDWIHGNHLCVASAKNVCVASFNGEECRACAYKSPGQCSRRSIFDGYSIDCSNVDKRYGVGSRLCGTDVILPGSSIDDLQTSPFYTTHGGSSPHHGGASYHHSGTTTQHHSGSSSDPIGVLFFTVFIFFAFILRLARCCHVINTMPGRQREQRGLQMYQRVNQLDPASAVELIVVSPQGGAGPVAMAKEAIPDTHFEFEFLDTLPGDTIALKLKEAISNDDWESIRDTLSSLMENEERSFYFGVISEEVRKVWPEEIWPEERSKDDETFCPFLDVWVEAEPNSSDCRILRAQVGTCWAWHARSAARADMVREAQWNLFFARLKAASTELKEARRLSPEDPLVYSNAVPVAKGLRGNEADMLQVDNCLEQLRNSANEPLLFRFHAAALEYYCAKWHGNHQQMFSYARSITSGLPAGHPLWALIPMAHYERNLIEQQRGYWRQDGVVSEIRHAYQHAFPGASETSSQATTSTDKYLEWTSRNYFAFALTMTGLAEEARRQIRVIGRRPTERPWWDMQRYKAYANALGFDVQAAVPVAEDAPTVVAQIV